MFPLSPLGASTCKWHERPLSAKDGITGEEWPVNFACDFDFHINPGFFDMPCKSATWETALLSPQGRHAVDFFTRKIQRLQPGSNPRSWVPEASMLTTRPPKPLIPFIYSVNNEKTIVQYTLCNSTFSVACWFKNFSNITFKHRSTKNAWAVKSQPGF